MISDQTSFTPPNPTPLLSSKKPRQIKNILIKQKNTFLIISYLVLLATILMLGVSFGLWASSRIIISWGTLQSNNPRVNFLLNIYDLITENYWDKITDEQLTNLYRLGAEKLSGNLQTLDSSKRSYLINLLDNWLKDYDETKQQELVTTLGDAVLASLTPNNRNRLYNNQKKQVLRNVSNNIDTETNLYSVLGINKNASAEQITQAYQTKVEQLSKESTPEAKQQLETTERAYQTLGNKDDRAIYDQTGAESTISERIIAPNILYLKIKQIAPTTIEEFKNKINNLANQNLNSLIIDLRGNFGGNIDTLPYLTGFFIGPNQYAYDYYRQGKSEPHKTITEKIPILKKIRKIIILIDKGTQSTAEVLATTLKKYNIGLLVGETTGGRGTVENFFPIKTRLNESVEYYALIVKAVVLRDDGQPIEGRGVEPNINIQDKDWQKQLTDYYNDTNLTSAIDKLITNK